jgi:succinate-semialdehyde dehydrogenase/glutarate-semialdehyde dehydrogenase
MSTSADSTNTRSGAVPVSESSVIRVINPATEELVCEYHAHSEAEVTERLAQAAKTYAHWKRVPMSQRSDAMRSVAQRLRQRRQHFATLMTTEMGKPIAQAENEIDKCAATCDFYADHAPRFLRPISVTMDETDDSSSWVRFEPLGPILAVMPWNFPFWQVFRFAVPSLMAGNVALIKHASSVSGTALAIEQLFHDAGFPVGTLTTLLIASEHVPKVIASDVVQAVTLTGSEQAGMAVAAEAGRHIKKTVLELGGSDAFIVLADADIERAATQAVKARTINSGQSCIAAKRFIVEEPIAEPFQQALVDRMKVLRIGDPLERETDIGPLARSDLVEDLHEQVIRSTAEGARLLVGGHRVSHHGKGYFYAPTVLGDAQADAIGMAACREETFGPVAVVIRAKNTDEAIALANHSKYGLGASLWTADPLRGMELARDIDAGCVFVNAIVQSDPRLPFGGIKRSGYGRELSDFGIREFVNIKTVRVGP